MNRTVHTDPSSAIARRLEQVRQREGFGTIMEFWKRLGGDDSGTTYHSARRYHQDREASPAYLARVTKVFTDWRLEWLITGEGVPTWNEAWAELGLATDGEFSDAREAMKEGFAAHLPMRELEGIERVQIEEAALWRVLTHAAGFYAPPNDPATTVPELDPEWTRHLAERISAAVAAPLRELGFDPLKFLPFELTGYLVTLSELLVTVFREATYLRNQDQGKGWPSSPPEEES